MKIINNNDLLNKKQLNDLISNIIKAYSTNEREIIYIKIYKNEGIIKINNFKSYFNYDNNTIDIIETKEI